MFVLMWALSSLKESEEVHVPDDANCYSPVEIPAKVDFAGEPLPLDRFDVLESLDKELLSNTYFHSQTIRFIKLAPRYLSVIEPILKEHNIPDDFKYLALAESSFNEKAVSPVGAVGLWQFMKGTAKDYGLEVTGEVDERYHMEKSTEAACKYLKDSYDKYGSWTMVAASYNAGRSFTSKQMARQKTDSYYDLLLGEETARYVFRIVALKLILSDPEKYGFKVAEEEKYPIIKTKLVEVSGPVHNFADFAKKHGLSYKELKLFNPWLRDAFLNNPHKKKYQIKIPVLN